MKKLLTCILFSTFLTLTGCVTHSLDNAIQSMPGYEFEEFGYSSSTNATKTNVLAIGAKIEGDFLTVDSLSIDHHNTFFNVSANVKGLKRPLSVGATSATGN